MVDFTINSSIKRSRIIFFIQDTSFKYQIYLKKTFGSPMAPIKGQMVFKVKRVAKTIVMRV